MSAAKQLGTLGCVGLLAMTAACGSTASSGSTGAVNTSITFGTVEAYTELDPAAAYDAGSWMVFYNVFQGLMSYQPGATTPTPDAASKCGFDVAYTTYTCTLRPGLKFSNGDPLDAAAVKFSFDRVVKMGQLKADNGSDVSILLNTLKSVDASGLTVTFHLKAPDATFPDRVASGVGEIVDPKVYSGTKMKSGTTVVGSGIYKIDKVDTGKGGAPVDIKMSLNPNYKGAYSTTDKPQNSNVTLKYFDTPAEIKTALENGDIDLNASNDLAPKDVVALQDAQQLGKGLQVNEGTGTETRMIVLNTDVPPFNKLAVRQAVGKLIDRNVIADKVYSNTVSPLYSVIPQGIGDQTTPFESAPYGPEPLSAATVKASLGNIKLPISFPLTFAMNSDAGPAEAQQIKETLDASGIFNVTLNPKPTLSALVPLWGSGKLQASLTGWQADYPDPDDFVSPFIGSPGQPDTFGNGYANPKIVNTLTPESLKQVNRAADDTASTFKEIQQQFADDAPYIPLWQNNQYIASQSDITGVPLTLDAASIMRFWTIGKS